MTRDSAIEAISTYFDEGTFQAELANLVSYETESQNSDQAPELKRYLVETMEPRLTAMGFACSFHDNPDPRGGPFLVGERREGGQVEGERFAGAGAGAFPGATDSWA